MDVLQLINQIYEDIKKIKVAHNYEFIWKITNIEEKIRSHSIQYSEPFYVSQFGYKVQLRLNFNSLEEGKLSLFVHLCKGEWDDILSWPFKANLKFEILNQKESQNVISNTFVTKDGNKCNDRPIQERSSNGFGFINFATIDNLERNVLNNDCMYIKVHVDTSNKNGIFSYLF